MSRREFVQDWCWPAIGAYQAGPSMDHSKTTWNEQMFRMDVAVCVEVPLLVGYSQFAVRLPS